MYPKTVTFCSVALSAVLLLSSAQLPGRPLGIAVLTICLLAALCVCHALMLRRLQQEKFLSLMSAYAQRQEQAEMTVRRKFP